MKSGNLNFLEPSGPLQACNGTALPLLLSDKAIHHTRDMNVTTFPESFFEYVVANTKYN
jgi:hypothetical protein